MKWSYFGYFIIFFFLSCFGETYIVILKPTQGYFLHINTQEIFRYND